MAPTDRAILVGINSYPGIGDLGGPENDASAFRDWLLRPDGGDVPEENIEMILSSTFPRATNAARARPTTEAFEAAVDLVAQLGFEKGFVGRRLYIFLAGHGFAPDPRTPNLLMANAAFRSTGHHVPARMYANWFVDSHFFHEVVLLMDCCQENYAWAPPQNIHLEMIRADVPAKLFYGLATKWSRPAREAPETSGTVRGLFTRAVIEGLQSARTTTGEVTGRQLKTFVTDWLDRHGGEELEEPDFLTDDDANFVLVQLAPPRFRLRVTISASNLGRQVRLVDGSLAEVPPTHVAGQTWEWELSAAGLYGYGFGDGNRQFIEIHGDQETIDVAL